MKIHDTHSMRFSPKHKRNAINLLCGKNLEKYVKGCKWRFMRGGGAQGRQALRCNSHTQNGISASTVLMRTICQSIAGTPLHKNRGLIRPEWETFYSYNAFLIRLYMKYRFIFNKFLRNCFIQLTSKNFATLSGECTGLFFYSSRNEFETICTCTWLTQPWYLYI